MLINVAPREGRVSRNHCFRVKAQFCGLVAPREGRVSRNLDKQGNFLIAQVAPREGRVSRNLAVTQNYLWPGRSRPARGV